MLRLPVTGSTSARAERTSRRRLAVASVAALLLALGLAGPARGSDCPRLIDQIYAATGGRFDLAAHEARKKAAEAARLHTEGKHREAQQLAQEGLYLAGVRQPGQSR